MILLFSAIAQLVLPWWIVPVIAYGSAWVGSKSAGKAFLSGFLAIFLLWTGYALWIYINNDGILASRVGGLLGGLPGWLMPLITGLLGGLASGTAAFAGFVSADAFRKPVAPDFRLP